MSYETGVSTSPQDLVAKIYTRAGLDGWTQVRNNGLVTGASGAQHSISDSGVQFNMVGFNTTNQGEIRVQASTGDSGAGVQFFNHTGSPNTTGGAGTFTRCGHGDSTFEQGFTGPHVAYHIFGGDSGDGKYLHVVTEGVAGVFFHLWIGTIKKAGTFTGGAYSAGTSLRSVSAAPCWPFTNNYGTGLGVNWIRGDGLNGFGTPGWQNLHGFAHQVGSNVSRFVIDTYAGGALAMNGRTPMGPVLAPHWATVAPSIGSTNFYILGHLPDVRCISMEGREPGEQITLGADTWHCFPVTRKTTDGISVTTDAFSDTFTAASGVNTHDSNLAGYAYREIP